MGSIDAIRKGSIPIRRPDNRHSFYPYWSQVAAGAFIAWLQRRMAKRRSRIALLELSDEQLKDIGISRADAHREAHRPFWD